MQIWKTDGGDDDVDEESDLPNAKERVLEALWLFIALLMKTIADLPTVVVEKTSSQGLRQLGVGVPKPDGHTWSCVNDSFSVSTNSRHRVSVRSHTHLSCTEASLCIAGCFAYFTVLTVYGLTTCTSLRQNGLTARVHGNVHRKPISFLHL